MSGSGNLYYARSIKLLKPVYEDSNSQITKSELIRKNKQYLLWRYHPNGGNTFCDLCRQPLNTEYVSLIEKHLRTKRHIKRVEEDTCERPPPIILQRLKQLEETVEILKKDNEELKTLIKKSLS